MNRLKIIFKKTLKITLIPLSIFSLFVFFSAGKSDFDMGKGMEVFFNVFRGVNMFYVDSVDNNVLLKKATEAMLSSLDPYTEYISKEDMEDFKIMTTGKYGGVGSLINKPYNSPYVVFDERYRGFPVDKAGIVSGDTIIAIDGVSMKDATSEKVSSSMKGAPGTEVKITVKSIRTSQTKEHILKRETITLSPISFSGMISEDIGYIGFTNFSEGGAGYVREELIKLKKNPNLKKIILDLRSNGGGIIDEAVNLLSIFLPKGSFAASIKGRQQSINRDYYTSTAPVDTVIPLVVLINRSSASASEIVAGGIQDYDRGVVVGKRSFGKGLVQRTSDVGYGGVLKVTIAKYYIPSGRCIQAIDYAHKNSDGSVNSVPDSLINEFKTKNGRKIYDGGGITPDIVVDPNIFSLFTASVYSRGYINSFANLYFKDNLTVPDLKSFKLDDKTYAQFMEYLKDKPVEYNSISESNLNKLIASAKSEKYYEKIEKEISQIQEVLKSRNTTASLLENKIQISELIEDEIIARYYYPDGKMEFVLRKDNQLDKAKEILSNEQLYNKTLGKIK